MDYVLAYATLGVLAFAWVYVLAHAFIMEDIWKGRKRVTTNLRQKLVCGTHFGGPLFPTARVLGRLRARSMTQRRALNFPSSSMS